MICEHCGAELRFGWRDGQPGWWHRDTATHDGVPIVRDNTPEVAVIPEPEVRSTPVTPKDDIVPGGVRTVTNLLAKQEWELRRLTHARGPYVGSKGEVLSISDTIVLGARKVDGSAIAVASWRDGKFDFAYVGGIVGDKIETRKVNATEMKNWIKGISPAEPEATE